MGDQGLSWEHLMTLATVPSANNAASELDLAESGHLASGHKDHCKPQSLL